MPVREELLAAVRARTAACIETGDAGPVLDPGALTEVEALMALAFAHKSRGGQAPDLEVLHAVGWLYWRRALALPVYEMDEELQFVAVVMEPVFAADPEAVPDLLRDFYKGRTSPPGADRSLATAIQDDPALCTDEANDLLDYYRRTGDLEALEAGLSLYRAALAALPPEHPDENMYLFNLASALNTLSNRTGDLETQREAVTVASAAVAATPEGHPNLAWCLSTLAGALHGLSEGTGDLEALREAVAVARAVVAVTPDGHPDRAGYLSNAAVALIDLAELTGDAGMLAEAVALARAAVATASDRASFMATLGSALKACFGQTGDLDVLREAAAVYRTAVAASLDGDRDRPRCLTGLGGALQALFEQTGDISALHEAVTVGRAAVAATPDDHPHQAHLLSNLGNALRVLFSQTGDLDTLREAVAAGRAAVAANPGQAAFRANVASSLQTLFEHTGDLETLREAIALARSAVAATADSQPARAMFLANLGISLRTLFEHTGDLNLLQEAAITHRAAVAATPDSHPSRASRHTNLANTMRALFARTGDLDTLHEAVNAGRAAVAAVADDHPNRAMYAANLGNGLHALYARTGDLNALHEAVAVDRAAVAATSDGHPNLPNYLASLGLLLQDLSDHTGNPDVLREAVTTSRAAVAAAHDGQPGMAGYLHDLARALLSSAEQTGNAAELSEARAALARATAHSAGAIDDRIRAGWLQSRADTQAGDHKSALAAMEHVVRLLPLAASRELRRTDREYQLGKISGIAGRAAAAALSAGRPERAVELLEQARGLLLAETISARSEQDRLSAEAPDLADRFMQLRDRLTHLQTAPSPETAQSPDASAGGRDSAGTVQHETARQLADQRRNAAAQWDALLSSIRARPGLTDFLMPPAIAQLQRQAGNGPIIFVIPDDSRCDALILTPDPDQPVQHIPLPDLSQDSMIEQANRLLEARRTATSWVSQHKAQNDMHEVLCWLWDTTAAPILDALGHTAMPEPGQAWPRVWWCPVGLMAYLPLHAAGHHYDTAADSTQPRTVLDRVVSSYTSTIGALGYAREQSLRFSQRLSGEHLVLE